MKWLKSLGEMTEIAKPYKWDENMGRKESAPILNENTFLDATNCNENHKIRR